MISLLIFAVVIILLVLAPALGIHNLMNKEKEENIYTFGAGKGPGKRVRKVRGSTRSLE
ncbi:MAG: hypothetical protein SFU25_05480 [Candidatus Caenarcaniphilales bacterium]|nr:hypothetical protein [Candidatus Caenarcaniphilales bacterium]